MNPERILLIRLSALGDVINTIPALVALREAFPAAHLGFAVEDRCAALIEGHPAVDAVHVYPRARWRRAIGRPWLWPWLIADVFRYLGGLRAPRYEVALDFQGNLKGAAHSGFSGAKVRVGFARGFCREMNWLFSNRKAVPPTLRQNRVEKHLALLAPLGVFPSKPHYDLPRSAESRRRIDAWLAAEGLARGAYAVLHPGTSGHGRLKRWPPERFAELASRLPWPAVVSWGPGERELAEAAARSGARVGPATASLLDLAELIAGAALFVGADSGPLHLASAVGTPSVALFGPKDPAVYAPWNPRSRVVRRSERMEDITVDDALAAVSALR